MTADSAPSSPSSASPPAPADPAAPAPALSVTNLDVTYKVRGQDRLALRDVTFSIARGESYGLVGESGSGKSTVALALVRYLPSNGRVSGGRISINGLDPLSMGRGRCATCGPAPSRWCTRSRGGRSTRRSGWAGRSPRCSRSPGSTGRGEGLGRGDAAQGADIGPGPGHAAVPARAIRRDGAAGGHRDGTGPLAVAADPGRADHRAGRHRRGRGARPGRGPAPGARHLGAVHQPQPGGDRQDVRPGRRALRGRATRAGTRARGVREPPAPVHGRAAPLHPAPRAAQGQRPAGHHPRLPADPRSHDDRVRVRAALRAGPGPLPDHGAAVLPGRRHPDLALLLPRAGPGPAPCHPGRDPRARGPRDRRSRRVARGDGGAVQDLRGQRPGPGRGGPGHRARRDARAGGRVGQRQDHAGARPAGADQAGSGLDRHDARQAAEPGCAAAAAGGPALAADRVPEPGLGAQPAPFGAGPDQPPAVPSWPGSRERPCGTGWRN